MPTEWNLLCGFNTYSALTYCIYISIEYIRFISKWCKNKLKPFPSISLKVLTHLTSSPHTSVWGDRSRWCLFSFPLLALLIWSRKYQSKQNSFVFFSLQWMAEPIKERDRMINRVWLTLGVKTQRCHSLLVLSICSTVQQYSCLIKLSMPLAQVSHLPIDIWRYMQRKCQNS